MAQKRDRARRFGCAVAVSALQAPTVAPRRTNVIVKGGRTATPLGRTKTLAGKEKIVASVQEDIEGADLIYSFEGSGMGIKVIDDLRDRLPEASKARIVKTTLFKRGLAAAGYGDDVVAQVPALSNMWVFSTTDDMKATVKAFDGWVKDNGLEKPIKGDNGELRPAKTTFRKIAGQEEPRCTLVVATPHTGRPHQIRRHAQALSMPIIGDSAHGDSKVNRWWRQERGLDRLSLHCLSIALPDPAETIVAPLEGSLADVLRAEPLWAEALSSEPRLDLAPVDIRSGSRG